MANIAFIGIGVMGGPMAGHLVEAGHELTVYNRTRSKAEAWVAKHGGVVADNPAQAATEKQIVITCVGNDDDLAAVTMGRDGAFSTMARGALFIDHTTVSARIARQLSVEAEGRGIHVVDAPVSGGQAGAENGNLSVMCGGGEEAFSAAELIMSA
ncbi:NAD(P)-dependent oxidoreductase, partial [Parasphingorhabdus sp.]